MIVDNATKPTDVNGNKRDKTLRRKNKRIWNEKMTIDATLKLRKIVVKREETRREDM